MKKSWKILYIIKTKRSYKYDIYLTSWIIVKWYKIQIIYLCFYKVKYFVDNWFDDISIIITDYGKDINLDVININWKIFKSVIFLSLSQILFHFSSIINDKNHEKIGYKKTDDEN